jgi:hypothetical protein
MDGIPNSGASLGGLRPPPDIGRIGAAHRENEGAECNQDLATNLQVMGNAEPKNGPVAVPAENATSRPRRSRTHSCRAFLPKKHRRP